MSSVLPAPLVPSRMDIDAWESYYAYALLAAALANPAERATLLADAACTYDTMPPQLRRYKQYALVRDEIARETARQ